MNKHLAGALTAALMTGGLFAQAGAGSALGASTAHMSVAHAGRYYLRHVCASNDATDRFDRKIWHGRKYIHLAEVRRRLPQLRYESKLFGRAEHRFAAALYNPPAAWPQVVSRNVHTMARETGHESVILLNMGSAITGSRWLTLNGRLNTVSRSATATSERIRAKLNLPAPGQGC